MKLIGFYKTVLFKILFGRGSLPHRGIIFDFTLEISIGYLSPKVANDIMWIILDHFLKWLIMLNHLHKLGHLQINFD